MALAGRVSAWGCVSLEEVAGLGGADRDRGKVALKLCFRVQQRLDWCEALPVGSRQPRGALCSAGLLITRVAVQRRAWFRFSPELKCHV